MSRTVYITGAGIVSAIGNNLAEVERALREGRSGVGEPRLLPTAHRELPCGEVKWSDEELRRRLAIPEGEGNRTALLGIEAIRQALAQADVTMEDAYLISGTTVGGMDRTERHFLEMLERDDHLDLLRTHAAGATTEWMATYFGLSPERTLTVSTACSSAVNALIVGADMIKTGEAERVVAGGSEALSLFHLNGFNALMILDHERCRPFDATRRGLNLGEGAAFVVLESAEAVARRGGRPLAILSGYGNRCDAFHQTASSADGEGAYEAMHDALAMAGLQPGEIDYVNAHGTGTPNNDASELAALRRIFADAMPPVSSTKAFTGHATSAAGGLEAVISLLALRGGFIPANLGWATPMPEGFRPSEGESGVSLRHVLCNSFGFGGNDSAMVFSRMVFPAESSRRRREDVAEARKLLEAVETGSRSRESFSRPSRRDRGAAKASRGRRDGIAEPRKPLEAVEKKSREEAGVSTASRTFRGLERVSLVRSTPAEPMNNLREFLSPMASRRLCPLLKAAMMTSQTALREAGIETPDAIIVSTTYGMLENSEKFLLQLCQEGEHGLSPTLFMQSTHNTVAGALAIQTRCHGYNITYTGADEQSALALCLQDAERLTRLGRIRNALVGYHNEVTPALADMLRRLTGEEVPVGVSSVAMVVRKRE